MVAFGALFAAAAVAADRQPDAFADGFETGDTSRWAVTAPCPSYLSTEQEFAPVQTAGAGLPTFAGSIQWSRPAVWTRIVDFSGFPGQPASHEGTDYVHDDPTVDDVPVTAAADGQVVYVRLGCPQSAELQPNVALRECGAGWGNHVVVLHGRGLFTRYAHLEPGTTVVRAGMHVSRGGFLGMMGNSGRSDVRHLHFELGTSHAAFDPCVPAQSMDVVVDSEGLSWTESAQSSAPPTGSRAWARRDASGIIGGQRQGPAGRMAVRTDRRSFLGLLGAVGAAACSSSPFGGVEGAPMPYPELEAEGAPGDLGLAHGRAFAGRIRTNLDFYMQWLASSGATTPEHLLDVASAFAPVLERAFPDMLEEIDGIARGAGLRREEILLINARTDLLAVVSAQQAARRVPACTALALEGHADGRPALVLAQNWDWDPLLEDAPVVLRLRPAAGPAIVSLVEAGMIGKIGFNQHRLGVCLNFLSHVTDGRPGQLGVPIHCLLRAVMGCSTVAEAIDLVAASPRCASANFLLAQHDAAALEAADLEIAPDEVAVLRDDHGTVVHTNHFLDPLLAPGCTSGRGPSTMLRYARATRLASDLERIVPDPVQRAKRVLESRRDLPYPISRHHNPDPDSSTLAGIVMDLTRNRFILTRGAPHRSDWVELPGVSAAPTRPRSG